MWFIKHCQSELNFPFAIVIVIIIGWDSKPEDIVAVVAIESSIWPCVMPWVLELVCLGRKCEVTTEVGWLEREGKSEEEQWFN